MNRQLATMVMAVLLLALAAAPAAATLQDLSPAQFKSMLEQHRDDPEVVLLDIRTPAEFRQGHIRGALPLDYYARDFVDRLKALDREKTYLIYCRSGNRTGRSLAIFDKLGFSKVYQLQTGLVGWARDGYPLVSPAN